MLIKYLLLVVSLSTCCHSVFREPCIFEESAKTFDFSDTPHLHWEGADSTLSVTFCPGNQTENCNDSKVCVELHGEGDEETRMRTTSSLKWDGSSLQIETTLVNNFTVYIKLHCPNGTSQTRYVKHREFFTASKETIAACPVTYSSSCVIESGEQKFDLQPLASMGELPVEGGSIKVCGPSVFKKCPDDSACFLHLNLQDPTVSRLKLIGGTLREEYLIAGNYKIAEVEFNCSPFDIKPKILLISSHGFFKYSLNTSYACPPLERKCSIELSHNFIIDLSSIKNSWFSYKKMRARLNPCGSLQPHAHYCGGSSRSLCLTSLPEEKGSSEGFILKSQDLQVTEQGDIRVQYEGYNGTFEITLRCSMDKLLKIDDSNPGALRGILRTPDACPKKVAAGKDCKLSLSGLNEEFDFTALEKSASMVEIGDVTLNFQMCTNSYPCPTKEGHICFTGLTQPNYLDGAITFSGVGSKCVHSPDRNASLTIRMVCDHSISIPELRLDPRGLGGDPDLCHFDVSLVSREACGKTLLEQNGCQFKSQGRTFSLNQLRQERKNYRVSTGNGSYVLINICRPLVPEEGMICGQLARICRVNLTEPLVDGRAVSFGDSVGAFEAHNDSFTQNYRDGKFCPAQSPRTTEIFFECSPNFESPALVSSEECSMKFRWLTPLVCPDNATVEPTTASLPISTSATTALPRIPCEIEVSEGLKLNLGAFSFTAPNLSSSACRSLCRSGAIFCEAPDNFYKLTHGPVYRNGVVFLEFRGLINDKPVGRENLIEFVCSKISQPVMVLKEPLKTVTKWQTPLVCTDNSSPCRFLDKNLVSNIKGVHKVEYGSKTFYLDLCQAIPPHKNIYCPGEASACEVEYDLQTEVIAYLSTLKVTNNNLTFSYVGTECPRKRSVNITTTVNLTCDKSSSKDKLKLVKREECNYVFEFPTSQVCGSIDISYGTSTKSSGKKVDCSIVPCSPNASSENTEQIFPVASKGSEAEGKSAATIFGAVVGSIFAVLLAAGGAFFALRRTRLRFHIRQRLDAGHAKYHSLLKRRRKASDPDVEML